MRLKNIIFFLPLLFSACGTKHIGHMAYIPDVYMPQTPIYTNNSVELQDAKSYANFLVQNDIKPIYLFIEEEHVRMQDETGNGQGKLPNNFRFSAMFAVAEFSPKVKVITGKKSFIRVLKDKEKRNTAFEIEGALTAYDENRQEINSGVDSGIDFGKGKGDTDYKNRFRNVDKVSSLTLKIFLKQNGEMFTYSQGTIDIKEKNRGYSFGLSINNSGFGVSAFQNKKEGLGHSIDRLLLHTLHQMIKDVVRKKGLLNKGQDVKIYVAPTNNNVNINQNNSVVRPVSVPTRKNNYKPTSINQDEEDFLNQLSRKRR
jgi:hypothetical protein